MKLTHIGISQFRSIGESPVMIDLSKRVTVLAGQNDCGKSNVLKAISVIASLRNGSKPLNLDALDNHKRSGQTIAIRAVISPEPDDTWAYGRTQQLSFVLSYGNPPESADCHELSISNSGLVESAYRNSQIALHVMSSDERQALIEKAQLASRYWGRWAVGRAPKLQIVPEFRQIDDASEYAIDGKGIVKLLAKWQHPQIGQEHLKEKFNQITTLLRDLLNRPNATLEVPPDRDTIIVSDQNRLPLRYHGTGVHQLIILAIAVLSEDDVIFGIEEPEIHLHPLLQKRFMQFLLRETTNRYIITTHSPALIAPSDEVDVIHLKMVDGITIPTRVDTDANTLAVLDDLGIQPSDLLQANSVIWVEGPSDRIYLNRWLELLDPMLREGVDYSIMFYGGRLLSHLSMEREDDELEGFVKLLRINQRSAILMDSDRSEESDTINETKRRIQNECATNTLFAWVTEGREIENCLPFSAVNDALAEHGVLEAGFSLKPFERFEIRMKKACGSAFKASWAYENHKPTWAHRITKHMTREQIAGDLEARLGDLIRFIKSK